MTSVRLVDRIAFVGKARPLDHAIVFGEALFPVSTSWTV
jgi:hypothetical protein